MKAKVTGPRESRKGAIIKFGWLGAILVLLWTVGCGTTKPGGITSAPAIRGDAPELQPGPLGVRSGIKRAAVGYDQPAGRVASAGEGAAGAANQVLQTPNLGHPQIEGAAGALGFVAAPFAACYGALNARHQRLGADKLSEAETDVSLSMERMASQDCLAQAVVEYASEHQSKELYLMPDKITGGDFGAAADTVLLVEVQQFRLARDGGGDDQFSLWIKSIASLVRNADGTVIWERPYEYRSGKAMFIDWSRRDGLESVARTAYRDLAERIVGDITANSQDAPIRLGAGRDFIREFGPAFSQEVPSTKIARSFPGVRPVANRASDGLGIDIYMPDGNPALFVQRPESREEVSSDAQAATEWAMDGLVNHRNSVVQAVSCVAAVPIGLWYQAAGIFGRSSEVSIRREESTLQSIASRMRAQPMLAGELARSQSEWPSKTATLISHAASANVAQPGAPGATHVASEVSKCATGLIGDSPAVTEASGLFLELQVVRAALERDGDAHQRLALCIETQARVRRYDNGAQVYSRKLSFRSRGEPLKRWAVADGRRLRQEWEQAYRDIGKAIGRELASHGLLPTERPSKSVIAKN